jgi:hypothetical protein
MNTNKALLLKYDGQQVAFRDLPPSHRKAIIWYMAADGEAWPSLGGLADNIKVSPGRHNATPATKAITTEVLEAYTLEYGNELFIIGDMPLDVLKDINWFSTEIKQKFKTFDRYHQWYLSVNVGWMPKHARTDRWPCIMGDNDELFQDGWHRFHCYVAQKAQVIPCIAFA